MKRSRVVVVLLAAMKKEPVQENVALCHVDNSVDERKGKKKI
jgi:hypothetical protein